MPIAVDIDVMLARRKMSVGELADRVGITPANLAVLKNGRAKAVRFATLAALCEVLKCQPGDLLAGLQVLVDLRILLQLHALALHHGALVDRVAQLALVTERQAIGQRLARHPAGQY